MNSIEAITSITALTAFIGILILAINTNYAKEKEFLQKNNSKINAIHCAAIMDAIFSNSADNYSEKNSCDAKHNKVFENSTEHTFSSEIISTAKKDYTINLEVNKHYLD